MCQAGAVRDEEAQGLAAALLAASRALVDGISAGVGARGFGDVRPAHGFAFARLVPDGATLTELAAHLDISRQAATQMVVELLAKGYVERRPHPVDARATLVTLTPRGWACTEAAEAAIMDTARAWEAVLGERVASRLREDLSRVAPHGPLRPTW